MMMMMIMMMMMMMIMMIMMMMMIMMTMMCRVSNGSRPPRGGKWAQRDSSLKFIVIYIAEVQNLGRC